MALLNEVLSSSHGTELFIGLFYQASSNCTGYIQLRKIGLFRTMIGNNVKGISWGLFYILPLAFCRRFLGVLEMLRQLSLFATRNSNRVTSEYKTGELTTTPVRFTTYFTKVRAHNGRCILNHFTRGPLRVGDVAEFRTEPQNCGSFEPPSSCIAVPSTCLVWSAMPTRPKQFLYWFIWDFSYISVVKILSLCNWKDAFSVRQLRSCNCYIEHGHYSNPEPISRLLVTGCRLHFRQGKNFPLHRNVQTRSRI